jgi:beta-carotene hydroxylase
MVAWPTVLLAAGIVATFALITTFAVQAVIPLWLGLILNTFILYADQTPLHEACHGNIRRKGFALALAQPSHRLCMRRDSAA